MFINNYENGILAPPRTRNLEDDEFDGTSLSSKWTKVNSAAVESYSDKIPSALFMQHSAYSSDLQLTQSYDNSGNFSITLCGSLNRSANNHFMGVSILDSSEANYVSAQAYYSSAVQFRTTKNVASAFSVVDTVTSLNNIDWSIFLLHIQRSTNNWELYYSHNGVHWTKWATTIALTFTVAKLRIQAGTQGGATPTISAFHWFRRDWITL